MTVPFIRKSTQHNSSWPGEFVLHRKAEFIRADLSFTLRFPLHSWGRPYISGNYDLDRVLQIPGLCITKLLDLFVFQDTRSAKLMCDERDLCQVFDYLHLLEGLEQGAPVTDSAMIGHKDSVMVWDERGETSCHLIGSRCCVCC
jgi:hypothetical protein